MLRLQPDKTIFKDLCYSSSYDYEMDEFMLFKLMYKKKDYEESLILKISIKELSIDEKETIHSKICTL